MDIIQLEIFSIEPGLSQQQTSLLTKQPCCIINIIVSVLYLNKNVKYIQLKKKIVTKLIFRKTNFVIVINTSGFVTKHIVVFFGSVRHSITNKSPHPLLTSKIPFPRTLSLTLVKDSHWRKTLKIYTGENKINCQSRMWCQYTCYFAANGSANPDIFQPKPLCIPRGIIPQNFSSIG